MTYAGRQYTDEDDTVTIELRRDTVKRLLGLITNPGEFNSYKPPMEYERRMAVAQRIERQIDPRIPEP